MDLLAGFAGISPAQAALVAAVAVVTSLLGGLTGYGTGVLLPLVLVPITSIAPELVSFV